MNYLYDGMKSIQFDNYPPEAWTTLFGASKEDMESPAYLFKRVPWLGRAVKLRSEVLSSIPFVIMKGDKIIDESENYQNKLGIMPNPKAILRRVESSLTVLGSAYLLGLKNAAKTVSQYRYIAAKTITVEIDKETGEPSFKRNVNGAEKSYTKDQIVYFWYQDDPEIETGPSNYSPAYLALAASGALMSMDNFVTNYFNRGAIKAQLLTVKGNPPQEERNKLKEFWKNLTGANGSWKTEVVNADAITPVQIGDGLEGLQDTELTASKREDISTALGIPQSILFSNAANYATAQQEALNFLNYTILPETEFIEETLNEQVFKKLGHVFKFQPQTIDEFQEDETRRAQAYAAYVGAGMKPSIAVQILGIELPEGIEPETLDIKAPEYEPVQIADEIEEDMAKWMRKAIKSFEKGKGAAVSFVSHVIPESETQRIAGLLEACESVEEIKAAFISKPTLKNASVDFSEVTHELKRANDLLDRSTDYMHIMKELAKKSG